MFDFNLYAVDLSLRHGFRSAGLVDIAERGFGVGERTAYEPHPTGAQANARAPDRTFVAFINCVSRRRIVLVLTTLASILIAATYLKFATAQFTSSALISIDQKSNAPLRFSTTITDAATESANIETQVEIIKSQRTLQLVVGDQKLIDDPALKPAAINRVIASMSRIAGSWMRSGPPIELKSRGLASAGVALQQLVAVRRLGTTYLIEVSATMPDPAQAAAVTNSVAQMYIADQQARREELARRQSQLLQERSDELEHHVREAEEAVEQLKFSGSLNDESSASAQVKLKDLQSLAQTYRVLHDKFLEQSAASWQQQFLSIPDATIANPGYPPLEKSSPRSLLILACAILIGVSLGSMVILIIDRKALGLGN